MANLHTPGFEIDTDLSDSLRLLADMARISTVQVRIGEHAGGSGIVWESNAIVTNAHVAVRSPIDIITHDDVRLVGEVQHRRPQADLALIRVQAEALVPAPVGDSSRIRTGDLVFSFGHPIGVANSFAAGVIHTVGHPAPGRSHPLIQADVRLAPGYSGGPMLDASGAVIGVNTMISGGLGLAIPSNAVTEFLAESCRPRLGVAVRPVTFPAARQGSDAGLLITEVVRESPAAAAGLCIGDIIVRLNGKPIGRGEDIAAGIGNAALAPIEVLRGDYVVCLEVRLDGGQPSSTKRAA